MSESLKVQVVVNPISGRAGARRVLDGLCRRVREAGWSISVHHTRGAGDARERARRSCQEAVRAFVVAGGDGTVNEVVTGMVGRGVPILVVPYGTENIFAKYLGTRRDAEWLWRVLREGREAAFDVPAMNGRRFLLAAGIGFDAEIVRLLDKCRRGHISYLSYFLPVWRTLWSYRHPHMSVEVDGALLFEGPGVVYVGNVPRYAIGLRILNQAEHDDGLLDICVLECSRRRTLLRHALNLFIHKHVGSRGVVYRQGKRVRVWSEATVPVQLDGDVGGWLPVAFEMTPNPVRFLVGAEWREGKKG